MKNFEFVLALIAASALQHTHIFEIFVLSLNFTMEFKIAFILVPLNTLPFVFQVKEIIYTLHPLPLFSLLCISKEKFKNQLKAF